MPVFISYRHPDRLDAFVINERLKLEGINTCLELFDPQGQTTDDICTLFNTNINACTHMITVLGQSGVDEWWVPFSLGSATQLNRRLAFYQCEGTLPGYLERWPTLNRREHIDLFVSAMIHGRIHANAERSSSAVSRIGSVLRLPVICMRPPGSQKSCH